jgi:hypothetical protein
MIKEEKRNRMGSCVGWEEEEAERRLITRGRGG